MREERYARRRRCVSAPVKGCGTEYLACQSLAGRTKFEQLRRWGVFLGVTPKDRPTVLHTARARQCRRRCPRYPNLPQVPRHGRQAYMLPRQAMLTTKAPKDRPLVLHAAGGEAMPDNISCVKASCSARCHQTAMGLTGHRARRARRQRLDMPSSPVAGSCGGL